MVEILYCIYNAKELKKPILFEIENFTKDDNDYEFKNPIHNFIQTINLGKRNLYSDSGLSTGDSPLEWIFSYTTNKELAMKLFDEEDMKLGASFYGGNYKSFMQRHKIMNS